MLLDAHFGSVNITQRQSALNEFDNSSYFMSWNTFVLWLRHDVKLRGMVESWNNSFKYRKLAARKFKTTAEEHLTSEISYLICALLLLFPKLKKNTFLSNTFDDMQKRSCWRYQELRMPRVPAVENQRVKCVMYYWQTAQCRDLGSHPFEIWGSQSGAAENSGVPGYDAVWMSFCIHPEADQERMTLKIEASISIKTFVPTY